MIDTQYLNENGIDASATLERLNGNERLYERMLSLFLKDSNASLLRTDTEAESALMHSHTLKGLGGNLGFSRLYELTGRQCALIREGRLSEALSMSGEIAAEAERLQCVIRRMTGEREA